VTGHMFHGVAMESEKSPSNLPAEMHRSSFRGGTTYSTSSGKSRGADRCEPGLPTLATLKHGDDHGGRCQATDPFTFRRLLRVAALTDEPLTPAECATIGLRPLPSPSAIATNGGTP
jgi:hypothetical protein